MARNPLRELSALGQEIWLDFIRRDMLEDGTLDRLIAEDGLKGMTTNPTIFANAIESSPLYDEDIRAGSRRGASAEAIFEELAIRDVQRAADRFRPVYDATDGHDGYVSIEVSPRLAHDTAGTIDAARRLHAACARPNVMIKIPGTREGLPAITTALSEGINVNVTLLFSVDRYEEVMDAWFAAFEGRAARGEPLARIASVASFFVSRVDGAVDGALGQLLKAGPPPARVKEIEACLHQAAVANARLAYEAFEERFRGPRYATLKARGAQLQRPLWASTSTKDPRLSDVLYVDTLIGPDTVNTLPPATVDAFRDHGDPRVRVRDDLPQARALMGDLKGLGIDMATITRDLEIDGVAKFAKSYDDLLETVARKAQAIG